MPGPYDVPDIEALIGGQGPDPIAALAQALRARQTGSLLQATGNKGLMASGQGLEQGANQDLERGIQNQHWMGNQAVQAKHFDALKQHYENMEEAARNPQWQPVPQAGVAVDRRTGETKPIPVLPHAVSIASGGGSRGAEPTLGDTEIDRLAQQYNDTGAMPKGITPRFSPQTWARIQARAAALPGGDKALASSGGEYKGNVASTQKQQILLDLTKSWEVTGKANLGVLKGISTQLVDSGSPLANKPLRYIYEQAAGDPVVTKFKAAHAAVVNEYAKILSGATGSAGVTDSARHEAEGMLPLNATPQQIAAAADVLELDAGNRLGALTQGLATTKGRLSHATPAAAPAPEPKKEAVDLRKKYGL